MSTQLIECSFLIPMVRDSDRRFHREAAWFELVDGLRAVFPAGHSGPETAFHDVRPVEGEYSEFRTGRIVRDVSRRYTVAVPEDRLDDLRNLLRRAATLFDQKAIYLSVAGIVEFVTSGREGGAV